MKNYFLTLLFIFVSFVCYGQYNVQEYISYLGKPVPDGAVRTGRDRYAYEDYIFLNTENNIVMACSVVVTSDFIHTAYRYLGVYHDYFEGNAWEYFLFSGRDIYVKDGIYAIIYEPHVRPDGKIVAQITFTMNLF